VGFFDSFTGGGSSGSFFTGLSNFGQGIANFGSQLLENPITGAFLGPLIGKGLTAFQDLIGLEQAGFTGSAGITGAPRGLPLGPLGTPIFDSVGGVQRPVGSISQPRPDQLLTPGSLQEELMFFQPGGAGTPTRGAFPGAFGGPAPFRPTITGPPPSIPASQPFGAQPGAGGFRVPAFPISTQASFPPSPFALATGTPGFQQAGVAGSLLRQLPGVVGGFLGGAALDAAVGGGPSTPMFRPTMAGARAMFFRTQNPVTGQDTWFRPAGRPLLWSGDLNACKRVNKIARRARRKR